VLDILKAEGVPATFFVLGGNALRWPDLVCRAASEGHAVGLHGQSHRKLTRASDAEVEEQVTRCRDTLLSLGIDPAPVYRTPHGFKSRAVFRLARRLDLSLWAWSRGVWDTDLPPAPVLERRATRFACDGMVLLVHDGRDDQAAPDVSPMLAALPGILGTLKARGFEFVRLTDV
jgi:peptidoglycan/xylan/chitin deacetylase (PgdA/CDA1 family)